MYKGLLFGALLSAVTAASVGCHLPSAAVGLPVSHNLPPAERILEPGPGVGGPGPGVLPPDYGPGVPQAPAPSVQVLFTKPESMQVRWDVGGLGQFDSTPLIVPGAQSFPQGGIYRLKLTNIEGREGTELYPSLEIGPATPRTAAFLAHNTIPIQFTEEDFDQVMTGNFVTKVIYLPDPEFQAMALAGVDTLVSTRLDPGVDPIVEADRRGAILAITRMGNRDLESPGIDEGMGVTQAAYAPGAMPLASGGLSDPGAMAGAYGASAPLPFSTGSVRPNYISGVTAPPWGMPMSGTPIGLPGPAHIPFGIPAGLQKHVMHNHTQQYIPDPTKKMRIHVQQSPGLSYPAPADKVFIKEHLKVPRHINRQPAGNMVQGDSLLHHGH